MHVVVGVIFNEQGEVLIAQRPANKYKPGLWEFPGGKVESKEDAFSALKRELQEEIAIQVISAEPWIQFHYDYGDRQVFLDTWRVTQFIGEPEGAEGQPIRWVTVNCLKDYEFPAGNQKILEQLYKREI
jgi:8-oxo-dGTP diphosphatase